MTTLDDPKLIKKLDKSDMAGYILQLPKQIEESLIKMEQMVLPADWQTIKNICLCGMGGSAVANHLVTNLPQDERLLPMQIVRTYDIPGWVDNNSLVILTSHSGKTQETLAAFEKAVARDAKIFIVAERGQLEKLGTRVGAIVFDYDTPAVPRASLGYQLGAVFGLLKKLTKINQDLQPAIDFIKKINEDYLPTVNSAENLAKKLAYCCLDRLPVVVGSGILQSVAWRWKTQFNENAKNLAFTEYLPEAMHNTIEGLAYPLRFQDDAIYLILKNSFDNQDLILQTEKFIGVLNDKQIRYEVVESLGEDIWSQKLTTLVLGDWVSYYLALLNNVDPTPVETIEKIKNS